MFRYEIVIRRAIIPGQRVCKNCPWGSDSPGDGIIKVTTPATPISVDAQFPPRIIRSGRISFQDRLEDSKRAYVPVDDLKTRLLKSGVNMYRSEVLHIMGGTEARGTCNKRNNGNTCAVVCNRRNVESVVSMPSSRFWNQIFSRLQVVLHR